jgi:hypothetical protein
MTYDELVIAVSDYCENVFSTVDMNTFIRQAEQRIYNVAQPANQRKNVTGTLTAGNRYLGCPADFLSVYSLAIYPAAGGAYEYLLDKDVNFIRQAYPSPTATGKPRYYALFGSRLNDPNELTFILGPTPDLNYGAELHYFYYPESIVTAGTSWLGDTYSPVLLYGTLVEAYTYMKGETDMLLAYNTKYNEALAQLNRLGTGLERGDAYRDGQAKIKVNP